jgi:hypothetical protein
MTNFVFHLVTAPIYLKYCLYYTSLTGKLHSFCEKINKIFESEFVRYFAKNANPIQSGPTWETDHRADIQNRETFSDRSPLKTAG